MTDINMSIIHSEADTCRDIFSTPLVTLPPQNSFPYISTPTVRPAPGLMCAQPTAQINIHMMLIDLNNQTARLRDFNKSLLDQLTSATLKIDFLVKKSFSNSRALTVPLILLNSHQINVMKRVDIA